MTKIRFLPRFCAKKLSTLRPLPAAFAARTHQGQILCKRGAVSGRKGRLWSRVCSQNAQKADFVQTRPEKTGNQQGLVSQAAANLVIGEAEFGLELAGKALALAIRKQIDRADAKRGQQIMVDEAANIHIL